MIKGLDGVIHIDGESRSKDAINQWVITDPLVTGDIAQMSLSAHIAIDLETYEKMVKGGFTIAITKQEQK
jgi:hypothetical protein